MAICYVEHWASQFDAASLDTKKMILARLIEKITVDRDYNTKVHTKRIPTADEEFVFEKQTLRRDNL